MNIYKVIYEDDLCYCYTSWFFNLDTAKKWCKLNKYIWMRRHVNDEKGHEKYGGCNGLSYHGT